MSEFSSAAVKRDDGSARLPSGRPPSFEGLGNQHAHSGVHQGCTRLTQRPFSGRMTHTGLCTFAGAFATGDNWMRRLALAYKQGVGGSSPSPPISKLPAKRLVLRRRQIPRRRRE